MTYSLLFNTPPQTVQSPSALVKCLALTEGNALVSMSAVMSSVTAGCQVLFPLEKPISRHVL